MFLEIVHNKPSPSQEEMALIVGKACSLCGGGAVDTVYGYRFDSDAEAQQAKDRVGVHYPEAVARISEGSEPMRWPPLTVEQKTHAQRTKNP